MHVGASLPIILNSNQLLLQRQKPAPSGKSDDKPKSQPPPPEAQIPQYQKQGSPSQHAYAIRELSRHSKLAVDTYLNTAAMSAEKLSKNRTEVLGIDISI